MQGGRPRDGDGVWAGERGTLTRRDESVHGVARYGMQGGRPHDGDASGRKRRGWRLGGG